ncbi:MAG: hypothetical protein R3B70_13215 [Polyangiaceae bacterium]
MELHRRHQKLDELQVDVAEAQVRLYRREQVPVLSQVWDLYGRRDEPLLKEQRLVFGAPTLGAASQAVYVRVNLRALRAAELLSSAPPALWPLVALTGDGAQEAAVRQACEAIEARTDLGSAERADHLAVLWFVAEAEKVPIRAVRVYLTKEKLMESVLYREIFEEGEAQGEARGEVRGRALALANVLVRGLMHHLGALDPGVRERIRSEKDPETLDVWCEELPGVHNAEEARRLVTKIMNATGR